MRRRYELEVKMGIYFCWFIDYLFLYCFGFIIFSGVLVCLCFFKNFYVRDFFMICFIGKCV